MAESPLYPSRPTCTNDLISRLTSSDGDPKERKALEALATTMIEIFKDDRKLLYVPEVSGLSSAVTRREYLDLVVAFSNVIIDGTSDGNILDEKLLTNYTYVLRRANGSLSPATTGLGSVLVSLQKRLNGVIKEAGNGTQYQLQLVCTLSAILDAMVDLKIYGLDRVDLHEPLQELLKRLTDHQELRLAQAATYAREALLGLPNNESSYHAFLRHACKVAQGASGVAGAVPTLDPAKLMDAIPDLMKVSDLIKSVVDVASDLRNIYDGVGSMTKSMKRVPKQKSWYVALRYTDMLIRSAAWQMLEDFIREVPCGREEAFLCGLYAQLEQAWVAGDSSVRDRVIDSIQRTIPQIGPKDQAAQKWIRLIADTVDQPSWKDTLPGNKHRFRLRKQKDYEPKLKRFLRENTKNLSTHLLERAWLECDEAQRFYADAWLCKYYTQGGRLEIKRLSGDLLDMDRCYINLAVIEQSRDDVKRQLDNDKREQQPSAFTLSTRLKVEASNTEKEVKLRDLFKERIRPNGTISRPKRILIRGRAGVGKTTLCKKIAYDFLHEKWWEELFDRIFWIPLRILKGKSRLEELFSQEYFSTQREPEWLVQALWRALGDETDERTLLLLDGLDEISGTGLTEKFRGLLNRHNVIITSRPHAVNLPGLTVFDLELETIGFHKDQVKAYLTKAVDKAKAKAIWSFIQSHWLIHLLVRIPIQLDALCYSWDGDLHSRGVPETMTALYQAIELKLWKKDILQLGKIEGQPFAEARVQKSQIRSQIKCWAEKEIELVELFAFTGLYNDIIEFDIAYRRRIYERPSLRSMSDDDLDRLSFLRTSDPSSDRKYRVYHFIHLTFQEYFAAQYFVRHWITQQPLQCLTSSFQKSMVHITPERFLQQEKYSGRYDVLWRFVAGLLQSQDEEQLRRFFEMMEDKPHDFLGPAHQRILMHCFCEVPPSSGLENLRTGMEAQLRRWALFEYKLRGEMALCREMEFPDNVLITILNEEPEDVKNAVVQALQHRSNFSSCLLNQVASFLGQNFSTNLERLAIDALGKQTALSDDILQAIVRRLEHSDWYTRQSAADALGKETALSDDVLQAIVRRLEHSDWYIRQSAADTLGKQTALSDNVLQAIVRRLEHTDWHIRQSAIFAIGKQTTLSDDVLQAIVHRLEDSNKSVRQLAIDALGKQMTLSDNILQAIVRRLQHSDWHVRQSAIFTLGKQTALSDNTLQAIERRLEDSNKSVRQFAIIALGKQTALSYNVLQAIVRRLEDSNWHVRQSAIFALGKETALSDNILQTIERRLEDSNKSVRQSAIVALGKQTTLSDNILQAIERRLEDSNKSVRQSAIVALGKKNALLDQAIESRLEDSDWSVRQSAIIALGKQTALSDNVLQAIECRLEDSNKSVRQSAIVALAKQTALSDNILQTLMYRLDDSDWHIRQSAIIILSKQTAILDNILQAIVRRLQHSDKLIRQSAINVLGKQTALSDKILQAIERRLEDSNKSVRQSAIFALGKKNALSDQAIESRLEDSDWSVRQSAIIALGKQTALSDNILQALMYRLDDSDWHVRQSAVIVLSKQTALSDNILQAIVCRLQHSDKFIRQSAINVLGKQTTLSDNVLQDIVVVLSKDANINSKSINMLLKQDNLYDSFRNFDVQNFRSLYKLLVWQSFSKQSSCYMQDEVFYINMPDRQRRFSLVQNKGVFLEAFRDEALDLERPPTPLIDDIRLC